jgi:hypothetical protein
MRLKCLKHADSVTRPLLDEVTYMRGNRAMVQIKPLYAVVTAKGVNIGGVCYSTLSFYFFFYVGYKVYPLYLIGSVINVFQGNGY